MNIIRLKARVKSPRCNPEILFSGKLNPEPYAIALYTRSEGYFSEEHIAYINEVTETCQLLREGEEVHNSHGTDCDSWRELSPPCPPEQMAQIIQTGYSPEAIAQDTPERRRYYNLQAQQHIPKLLAAAEARAALMQEGQRFLRSILPQAQISRLLHASARSVVFLISEGPGPESVIKLSRWPREDQPRRDRILRTLQALGPENHILPIDQWRWIPIDNQQTVLMLRMPCISAVEKKVPIGYRTLAYTHRVLNGYERTYLSADALIRAGVHLAGALKALHAQGLVHQDVKPDNLFYRVDGQDVHWYLGDFDAVQPLEAQYDGRSSGTLAYMSPERIARRPFDQRSDIYAWGRTMFFFPFNFLVPKGITQVSLEYQSRFVSLYAVCEGKRHHTRQEAFRDHHRRFFQILEKALAEDPAQRHCDAAELLAELEKL